MRFPKEDLRILYKAEKNRNKTRDFIITCTIVISICIVTLIISLIYGKYILDKKHYEHISGKTIFVSIENAASKTKTVTEGLSYVNSVRSEYENGKLMMNGFHYASCISTDQNTFMKVYAPAFSSITGEFPNRVNEIMLSRKILTKLGVYNPTIGMKINLEFYWTQLKYSKLTGKQNFILSGFYDANEDEREIFTAFIPIERMQEAKIPQFPCTLLVDLKKPWWSKTYAQSRLRQDIPLIDKQRIVCETSASFKAIEKAGGNIYLTCFILGFVMLCAHLIIYNILVISSVKDLKDYNLLHAVGASYIQLRTVLFTRTSVIWFSSCFIAGFVILSIQVVFGLILGENGYLGKNINHFPFCIYLLTSILSGIVLFISTFAIYRKLVCKKKKINKKQIHMNGILSSRGKAFKRRKEKEILFRLALNRLFRSKRSTLFSMVLLFLGCEVALIGTIIISGMDQTKILRKNPDFTVEIPMNTINYLVEYSTDNEKLARVSNNSLLELKHLTEKMATKFKITQICLVVPDNDKTSLNFQILGADNLPILLYDDGSYFERIIDYARKNNISIDEKKFKDENGIIILHENSSATEDLNQVYQNDTNARTIHISSIMPIGTDMETVPVYSLYNCGFFDMNMGGFPRINVPWKGQNNIYLLARKELFDALQQRLAKQYIRAEIYADENNIDRLEDEINLWIEQQNRDLQSEIGNAGINQFICISNSDVISQMKSYLFVGKVMAYSISMLLLFIGLGSHFITNVTNMLIYRSELDLLNVLGITKKSVSKILVYEGMIYAVGVILLCVSIGNLLVIPIVQICNRYESFSYHYPLALMVGIISGLLIIGRIIPLIWTFSKKNSSEAVNYTDI